MNGILEQAPGTAIDYVREIQDASTYNDIADLFKKLFGVAVPSDPDKYKKQGSDYGLKVRGVKAREKINEQCKEILSRVTDPAQLTPEEREILLQYSGRGGLTDNSQWEYYTPTPLAEGIWEAMKANGFSNGNVLEPSCGAGVFLGTKPAGVIMSANDLDPTSAGVAALLNPGDKVSNNPFEEIVVSTADDTFDSCVGNVPFGNARGQSMSIDPAYKNERRVERYFLLRILDKIKPGGLACLVVPTGVIGDKSAKWKEFRTAVSRKAEFLGAHKMPSSMFGGKGGQGTDTVTDVIILRKHGRDLLDKLRDDEIPTETLREANVYWDEFISGKYWQGEGRPFIMGKYVPKDANDRFAREKVEGKIDDATLKRNLARKFHSRIKWDVLKAAEPILRNYAEGDSRYINGDPYEYRNGEWQKIETAQDKTALDKAQFGAESVEELTGILSDTSGALLLTVDQAYQVYNTFPHLVGYAQKSALEFAMSQPREDLREQLYRGSILGSMLAKLAADEEGGEDVSGRRAVLQDAIVQEMNKYGHPANNAKFKVVGASSRAFGMFMNSIDTNGKFSDLLAGTLDKSKAKGYAEDDVESIVSWLAKQNGDQIEFEDVQALYKGTAPMESISDLAQFESVAITPDGMLEPFAKYCSGDVVTKMNELRTAMCATDDEKIIDKFQKQIDAMNAKIKRVPVENIVFGLQNKWFSKQYILDYLHENGYSEAVYGEMREVEEQDYDGRTVTRKKFVIDPDAINGEFRINGVGGREPKGFVKQLESYLNGGNITSRGEDAQERISQYKRDAKLLEAGFDSWMKQHPDSDDLAEDYSLRFNGYVQVEYDTGNLGIDDLISGEINPHTYQNAEVRRLSEQGSGICGFGTGLGKSFTALAMAAYNYKKGRAKRTCVVVPSAVLENWYHEARTFYNEGYMRSNVLFVGLEPKVNKDGDIERKPILDEDGNPKTGKDDQPLMQDVVRFTKSKEDTFAALSKIPQSNYSLVVMTKEKFQSIPVRPETMKAFTEDMVKRNLLSDAQAKKASDNAAKKGGTSYADDVRKNQLEGQFSNEGGAKKGELPYLEDMGFDSIISDESHFFKNSLKAQDTGGIVGVPSPEPSQIAVDMSIKCDWLRRNNNGRGVYGLTATPVTNSPIEIFNMLSLVAPKEDFEQMGIYTVDDFVRMFGEIEERDRINVANEIVQASTLVGFRNLDGLRNLFGKYVNIKTVQDVDDEIHVPNAEETQDEVPITETQQKVYALLRLEAKAAAKNAEAFEKWLKLSGGRNPRSMFSIMRDMDRCTTDMDLYLRQMTFIFSNTHKAAMERLLPTLPTSFTVEEKDEETQEKIKKTYEYEPKIVDNGNGTFSLIVHEQHETAVLDAMSKEGIDENEANHPLTSKYAKLIENLKKHIEQNGKQIIFTEEKSQHQKLKRILVHNLPFEDQNFGIINAEDAAGDKLDKISKAYNSGTIRIVIANKKAEVGVNLQKGTTAIHHLTLPWTPASINQRNGRGVRQGNKVDTVEIYYYHGKGTFDAYRKQLLEAKANWIGQLLSGKESTAENADIAAQEEMNALMSGNLEEYRKKKAEAEEKRKNAARGQLVNRLKMLASIQNSLATLEERREAAREKAQDAVEEQKLRIKRYEQGNKGEETVKKAKADLAKLQAKLDAVDKKFDEEKAKSEAQRNMNSRMLREAAKKGELPFDETLIDHPETCLITLKGEIYRVGEYLEFPYREDKNSYYYDPEGLFQIERLDQEDKELILRGLVGYGGQVRIKADKVANKGKKVSYSASEIAIKKLMSGSLKYSELAESGLTKQQFLENLETMSLEVGWGAVMQKPSGEYVLIKSRYEIEDDLRYVWPEPDNEDFRKKVLSLWLQEERIGGYNQASDLMRELFGNNYATLALEYGNKASPSDINIIIGSAWDSFTEKKDEPLWQLRFQNRQWDRIMDHLYEIVLKNMADAGFDNKDDAEAIFREFAEAKKGELEKLSEDAKKAAEEQAKAKLRESQGYKEVPAEIDEKFKELGMTICYNTQDTRLKMAGGTQNVPAFSRVFVQDTAGLGGLLYKAKERIKSSFKAQFTKSWNERFGSWWHVPAEVDLESLYKAIAG